MKVQEREHWPQTGSKQWNVGEGPRQGTLAGGRHFLSGNPQLLSKGLCSWSRLPWRYHPGLRKFNHLRCVPEIFSARNANLFKPKPSSRASHGSHLNILSLKQKTWKYTYRWFGALINWDCFILQSWHHFLGALMVPFCASWNVSTPGKEQYILKTSCMCFLFNVLVFI